MEAAKEASCQFFSRSLRRGNVARLVSCCSSTSAVVHAVIIEEGISAHLCEAVLCCASLSLFNFFSSCSLIHLLFLLFFTFRFMCSVERGKKCGALSWCLVSVFAGGEHHQTPPLMCIEIVLPFPSFPLSFSLSFTSYDC